MWGIYNVTKDKWVKDFDADPVPDSLTMPDYVGTFDEVNAGFDKFMALVRISPSCCNDIYEVRNRDDV